MIDFFFHRILFRSPPKKSTSMQNLSNDMVNRIEYDEKEQECIAKEEQVQVRNFY